jgi:acetyl esterase/lipase
VNADYSKAGFLYIYAGGKDALSVETNYLVDELKKAGVPHEYMYQEHMPHDWFLFNFPESSRLREEIAKKISE